MTLPRARRAGLGEVWQAPGFVKVELPVLDAGGERVPFGLGEVELSRVGVGRVVHDVELGFARLDGRG